MAGLVGLALWWRGRKLAENEAGHPGMAKKS
jgi:hypothetical protein